MRKLLYQLSLLCCLAAAGAAATNSLSPRRIAWRDNWHDRMEAKAMAIGIAVQDVAGVRDIVAKHSHVILDARPADDFEAGHLPTAISLPLETFDQDFPEIQLLLHANTPVLVYCAGNGCDESFNLARVLRDQGYLDVTLFPGGYRSWQDGGLPIEREP